MCLVPGERKRSLIFYPVRAFRIRDTGRACFRGQNAGLRLFCGGPAWLAKESVLGFLERMQKEEARLGCVKNGSLLGNPVWFSQEYFGELLELQGDEGGKKVLRRHQEEAVYYEIENGKELEDIDRLRYNSPIKR